jgi:integrase
MAKIKFYLATPQQNISSIYARISYGAFTIVEGRKVYNPLKYYLSESIKPEFWDKKQCRARKTKLFPEYPEFNARLDYVESQINKTLFQQQSYEKTATLDELKKRLDIAIKPDLVLSKVETKQLTEREKIQQMSLFEFFDYYLKTAKIKPATLKSYTTTKNSLAEYRDAVNINLSFKNVDIDFYNSFIDFLQGKKLSKNTIGLRIKIIKTVLREAHDRDIEVCNDYTKKTFKRIGETSDAIYLNDSELKQIYETKDLPLYLERARDLFLIGCYTGLRVSDYSRLTKNNIKDGNIEITTQKTDQKVVIPIHFVVRQILMKYNYQFPKSPTGQVFNRFLKEIAKAAKINEIITTEITKGGMKVTQSTEKYHLVCSHTARRSFATNAFLADIPSISIMKITGHKTESAFMKYIKMSGKDNAIKMQLNPFFQNLSIAK